jgi:hypothetical protein
LPPCRTQLEAKLKQSSKKLRGAVQRLHEAVDADNCNAMAAFMKDVLTPEYKVCLCAGISAEF